MNAHRGRGSEERGWMGAGQLKASGADAAAVAGFKKGLQFWRRRPITQGIQNLARSENPLKRISFRPTYSNVVATLALFFALAGGAWAATQLPKESVGSTQLKNGAVTPGKLSAEAKKGFTGARGEAGAQGALGPRGTEGPRGENGTMGATGMQGVRGATGATGAAGPRGEAGEIGLRGERGDRGAEGARGSEGERGEPGQKGEKGDPGQKGEQGDPGDKGEQGEPGEKGDPGPTGPSDAYVDVTENQADEITHKPASPNVPLEVTSLPAGEYVVQAALTVQGITEPALAECKFGKEGPGIALGSSDPFFTSLATPGGYASLGGMTTAVVTEPSTVFVTCEAAEADTSFLIPAESGHLTVTMVGALHSAAQ